MENLIMRGLRFLGNGITVVEDMKIPEPKKGEVLLKVIVSALCGSEYLDYQLGNTGVPGHEFSGIVIKTNACGQIRKGMRVTVNVLKGCGECYFCKTGQAQFCSKMEIVQGGHAQYAAVPEQCCIPLPDCMDFKTGVLLGGDTLGVAFRAVSKLKQEWARRIVVSGAGPIGLGVISLLKYYGYHVTVWEPNPLRRKWAVETAGADIAVIPPEGSEESDVPDAIFECSGNAKAQRQALESVRPTGTVVLCGENYKKLEIIPSDHIIHKEIVLTGAFYFTKQDFYELCEIHQRGFNPMSLVSHIKPLEEAPGICKMFFDGKTAKVLFVCKEE